ncbi:ABC-type sugar transport system permease subunit [Anaerotaenia torta]|uniref:carbohydrate ABC transporter permease n=1 Tax=Anaerotaenia torta TaxID=433293 RepID=UPI003D1A877C
MKHTKRRKRTIRQKNAIAGYFFISPFIIGFIWFILLPTIESIRYSVSNMTLDTNQYELTTVGLVHFKKALFIDTIFNPTLINSISEMIITVPVILIFSFFIANILNQKFHGRALARAIFFLPVIVTSGVILKMESSDLLLQASYEMVNGTAASEMTDFQRLFDISRFLRQYTGLNGPLLRIITMATDGIYDIAIASGVQILIFLAGLQSISPSIFEASNIEGATGWENFWKITLPMVSPLILVNAIYTIINSFTNASNEMMILIDDTIFGQVQFGYGSAMAWIYFVLVALLLAVVSLLMSKLVFYET